MKLSIVIPLYNGRGVIARCLDSVFAQDLSQMEVIVVDNGSGDHGPALVAERYPSARLIRNVENLGAAAARNQGIALSRAPWVVTLDCDVVLEKGFLDVLGEEAARTGPHTGMIQAKVLYPDARTIYSTGILLTSFKRFYDRGRGKIDAGQFDAGEDVLGPCSAAAAYRREMLDQVKDRHGYFDERFFFLVEDVDLAWRARRAGWKTVFCPRAVCYHSGNGSNADPRLRQYLSFRNRRFMRKKNEGPLERCAGLLAFPFYDLPRYLYLACVNPYFFHPPRS